MDNPEVRLRLLAVRANLAGVLSGRLEMTDDLLRDQVHMLDMVQERLAGREVA